MKTCNRCNIEKDLSLFPFRKDKISRYKICRNCYGGFQEQVKIEEVKTITHKMCRLCNIEKEINQFSFDKSKDCYYYACRICSANKLRLRRESNRTQYNKEATEYRNSRSDIESLNRRLWDARRDPEKQKLIRKNHELRNLRKRQEEEKRIEEELIEQSHYENFLMKLEMEETAETENDILSILFGA